MKKHQFALIILLVFSNLLVSFPQIKAEPKIWTVDDDGIADFQVIQKAINSATDGDTIIVMNGIYTENLLVNKSVTIRSDNKAIVDGGGNSSVFNVDASNVNIIGFVVQNALVGVLLSNSSDSVIGNNTIWNLVGHDNTAILADYNLYSNNCIISDNLITNNFRGLHLINSENFTILNNIIQDNDDFGIRLLSSKSCNISRNIIARNENIGIQLATSPNNTISENTITNSSLGIWVEWNVSSGNKIIHNNIVHNSIQTSVSSICFWDDGYPSGGNYWSTYNGTDNNGDGIGDTPYIIDENNQDNYPFIAPIDIETIPEFPSLIVIPLTLTISIIVIRYNKKNKKQFCKE